MAFTAIWDCNEFISDNTDLMLPETKHEGPGAPTENFPCKSLENDPAEFLSGRGFL